MPPKLPPMTADQHVILRYSMRKTCELTQSLTSKDGKSGPQDLFVSSLIVLGPVLPKQLPMLLGQTTKNLLVSIGLSGPM